MKPHYLIYQNLYTLQVIFEFSFESPLSEISRVIQRFFTIDTYAISIQCETDFELSSSVWSNY